MTQKENEILNEIYIGQIIKKCSEIITLLTLYPELNPICYLLALLAHHFLHVSRIKVKSLTLRLLMSYIYIYIYIYDISNLRVNATFYDYKTFNQTDVGLV